MKYYDTVDIAEAAYDSYLMEHISNVALAWSELQSNPMLKDYAFVNDKYQIWFITKLVNSHDRSKYSKEEYDAYRKHFYPTKLEMNDENSDVDYDNAWKHHYTTNPHHWQYWVKYDSEKERNGIRFIRECYLVEMICDWIAMSKYETKKDGKNHNALEWFNENSEHIVMSDEDREFVFTILNKLYDE